jgi:plasmid stability protein
MRRRKSPPLLSSPLAGSKERFVLDNDPVWLHIGFIMKPNGGVCMATVTVKNIPDELYDRLKSVAEINRRSINSEIIMCIENAVISRRINLDEVIENARQLRQFTAGHLISDEEFNQAKAEGRL